MQERMELTALSRPAGPRPKSTARGPGWSADRLRWPGRGPPAFRQIILLSLQLLACRLVLELPRL